jgi:hypothetical protein
MKYLYNTFRFIDIVRKPNAVLLIRAELVNQQPFLMALVELNLRVKKLRADGFDDTLLAQELLAIKEFERERERDRWTTEDEAIDISSLTGEQTL